MEENPIMAIIGVIAALVMWLLMLFIPIFIIVGLVLIALEIFK